MKKMVLGLSLSLAALAFLMSPALAAPNPAPAAPVLSAADQDFLASLAAPVGTPAPELTAKRPAIGQKAMCTANCWNGGTVSCTGTGTCTAVNGSCPEPGHVTCDGTPHSCSACVPSCDDLELECEESCSPCAVRTFQCSPYICHCNFKPSCLIN